MKVITLFFLALVLATGNGILGQDLSESRIAVIGLTGSINGAVLNALDPRNITTIPYTQEEKDLQNRINNRLEKFFQDDIYDITKKRLEEKGIQLEPLSTSEKIANLNEKGYPNPLSPKSVIKKKNDDYADYFLKINITCAKPLVGGLLGFKMESRVRMVLYDEAGTKIKTINEEVKDSENIKSTDFDEKWTVALERFNRMDWYTITRLEERLLPIVDAAIVKALDQL